MDGNEIKNLDGNFSAEDAERIGSWHFCENYEGEDVDERLDEALSAVSGGETIILEEGIYEKERTGDDAIGGRVRVVGVSQSMERSGASTLGDDWEFETNVMVSNLYGWDGSSTNSILFNSRSNGYNITSMNIDIESDEVVLSMLNNCTISIGEGYENGVIGARSRSSVSGGSGYQKVMLEDVE